MDIRETRPTDHDDLAPLYRAAFPEEDLRPLVAALHDHGAGILSLVATDGHGLAGHVLFTGALVGDAPAALLGPVAVQPDRQGRGIGGALVRDGLARLREWGTRCVCVLGDPAWYGRFGFTAERNVTPPYPLPDAWREAWQSLALSASEPPLSGPLDLPEPWMRPALWRP